ncbi:hypothetical protein N4Q55_26530, partial [Salmonella enterica subsp. enterica serovar Pomona]|uniref:hypothetical protein n=1 Tax=Salmonella enterica TaxID=28901 RepID=UPI00372EFD31
GLSTLKEDSAHPGTYTATLTAGTTAGKYALTLNLNHAPLLRAEHPEGRQRAPGDLHGHPDRRDHGREICPDPEPESCAAADDKRHPDGHHGGYQPVHPDGGQKHRHRE